MANQYINKVVKGTDTLIDLTADTVTASALMQGYTAHDKSGAPIVGTATGGGTDAGTVTQDPDGYLVLDDDSGGKYDPSDATATAADILSPKTAYISGGKVTGSIVTKSSSDLTASNLTVTAPSGYYASNAIKTLSDGNLLAENIKKNITIFGVTGLFEGGGGGLEYESGTYTPAEDIAEPTISFSNQHSSIPIFVMMTDATGTDDQTQNSNYAFVYNAFNAFTGPVPSSATSSRRYGLASYVYRATANPAQAVNAVTSPNSGSNSSYQGYWITTSGFNPSSASTARYWRSTRTYKWIAVWAPTS